MVIRALGVGGGILALAPVPGADGRYADDLAHIAEWAPALVATLVTPAELSQAGAADFGPAMMDRGTCWLHLAVVAGEGPDVAFRQAWPAFSSRARRALAGGGRVMVQGGRDTSRAGMAALRLMIETGEDPDEALARLRAALPAAAAAPAQLHWARQATRGPALFMRRTARSAAMPHDGAPIPVGLDMRHDLAWRG
jgi:hypothetical protein